MSWNLAKWNDVYIKRVSAPMTDEQIDDAICYLRQNKYPRPDDCPMAECPQFRPACCSGVCRIAVEMCGDF